MKEIIMKPEYPTLEYLTRPIKIGKEIVSTQELAVFGRMCLVALWQGDKVNKAFAKKFLKEKILIYTNPDNLEVE